MHNFGRVSDMTAWGLKLVLYISPSSISHPDGMSMDKTGTVEDDNCDIIVLNGSRIGPLNEKPNIPSNTRS
jgi:hypothetical protein